MSFTIWRHFRHLNFAQLKKSDPRITNRLCIHCTVVHKQDDVGPKPENLVGPSKTLKSISKEDKISKAMQAYLQRKQKADAEMDGYMAEYDLGRRHLANMMGLDETELSEPEIRRAIAYLLPSGLHNKRARPLMESPTYFIPHVKGQEFDLEGRPTHFLYYTMKPNFYELMHTLAWKHEMLKKATSDEKESKETLADYGFEWISYKTFSQMFGGERITQNDYEQFLVLIQRMYQHPLSYREKSLFEKFQKRILAFSDISESTKPKLDRSGREYMIGKGKRKTVKVTVKLISNGSGNVSIQGKDITYFEQIIHRQAVLAPLHLCGVIDKFDMDARVECLSKTSGPTAEAGAIRLAVARALRSFVPEDKKEQLRIAGYLTSDPRTRERKKPGQEKARRKFTWKRR